MITVLEPLPRGSLAALERAVRRAAEWRGYYVGHPEALAEFDEDMKAARAALAAARRQDRAVRQAARLVEQGLRGTGTALH